MWARAAQMLARDEGEVCVPPAQRRLHWLGGAGVSIKDSRFAMAMQA
jgi:hypothetical protein